jgi:hypothetical protein
VRRPGVRIVRIVGPDGVSRALSEIYPTEDPADSSAIARNLIKSLEKRIVEEGKR